MSHSIERVVELDASVDRVWRAVTDSAEFGAWFGVQLDGPFVCGEPATGTITHPGYEHVTWRATIVAIEPQTLFAFTWHPYAIDPTVDYSNEAPTRVEFRLEPTALGTRLTIRESDFGDVPAGRRDEAMRMNSRGWDAQTRNIRTHVEG